jgi:heme A synthase
VLLAVIDASRPRRTAYTITAKSRQAPRRALLLVPHGAVVVLVGAAMLVSPRMDVVHALGGLAIAISLLLLVTTLSSYRAPYDKDLSKRQRSVLHQGNERLSAAA